MDGRMKITTNILMIAPRAIRIHRELIISILEYMPTPKVAAKKLSALTMIDWMELRSAVAIASFLIRSVVAKLLVLCCHENRIIDRRAELNRT